jgi:hypothetical protein
MTIKELIERQKQLVNGLVARYNELSESINDARTAEAVDDTRIDQLRAERAPVAAELATARGKLAEYEAEAVEDAEVQRAQSVVTPVERTAGDNETRDSRVQVTEKRTYRKELDARGQGKGFMADVAGAFLGSWDARERLDAHMREERVERPDIFQAERAAGTAAFAGFVVPQYLIDMNVGQATAKRPFADLCTHHDLPEKGMTVYLSKVTTGTTVTLQAAEMDAASETDIDDTLIPISVQTASGAQTLTRQAIERGLGTEEVTWADLQKRHATRLDTTLLNQATNGLTNKATSVAYTDASPTAAELYPKILAAISGAEGIFLNDAEVDAVVMHPRRWRWLSSQMTSTWPFISGRMVAPQSGAETTGVGYDKGVRGYLPDGTPVFTDANIATNLGAGTNEDEIYAAARAELHLWEDPNAPMFIRAEQTQSKKLAVDLVLYSYFAYYVDRYTGGHGKVAGTGLVTPVFA